MMLAPKIVLRGQPVVNEPCLTLEEAKMIIKMVHFWHL